jgi:hypothetical protein
MTGMARKHFRFKTATLGVEVVSGTGVMLPKGDIVLVVRQPSDRDERKVNVL